MIMHWAWERISFHVFVHEFDPDIIVYGIYLNNNANEPLLVIGTPHKHTLVEFIDIAGRPVCHPSEHFKYLFFIIKRNSFGRNTRPRQWSKGMETSRTWYGFGILEPCFQAVGFCITFDFNSCYEFKIHSFDVSWGLVMPLPTLSQELLTWLVAKKFNSAESLRSSSWWHKFVRFIKVIVLTTSTFAEVNQMFESSKHML